MCNSLRVLLSLQLEFLRDSTGPGLGRLLPCHGPSRLDGAQTARPARARLQGHRYQPTLETSGAHRPARCHAGMSNPY